MKALRLLEPQLQIGLVSSVAAGVVKVNLDQASMPTATVLKGGRYGLGEVGEFVLIEAEAFHLLGRITEARLPERERLSVEPQGRRGESLHPIGSVTLLGTYDIMAGKIRSGVQLYPRLGARVYSAPHEFLARLPSLLDKPEETKICLHLGHIKSASDTKVEITPERIFGRHCAVLGTTGGGKSFTVARLLGECAKLNAKVILLDATGEYRGFKGPETKSVSLLGGEVPAADPASAVRCKIPLTQLTESDFMALFQPSGRSQAPLFREALKSLRLLRLRSDLGDEESGALKKAFQSKKPITDAMRAHARFIEAAESPFDLNLLAEQLRQECVYDTGERGCWGRINEQPLTHIQSLLVRITSLLSSKAFAALFSEADSRSLMTEFDEFMGGSQQIFRISLENISFENSAREILANLIGRWLLGQAREGKFQDKPVVVVLDEAHQFLNKSFGFEDSMVHLDAFELIAKEGRKYGLNICLATQRPRDLPEGVLSQMGTLIVHRLTNDKDREIVERACGEIDRSASAFLPNLQPGEAALIGVDFPIPMTIQFDLPLVQPQSAGPEYQIKWVVPRELQRLEDVGPIDARQGPGLQVEEDLGQIQVQDRISGGSIPAAQSNSSQAPEPTVLALVPRDEAVTDC